MLLHQQAKNSNKSIFSLNNFERLRTYDRIKLFVYYAEVLNSIRAVKEKNKTFYASESGAILTVYTYVSNTE